jgi:hypothetical protein
MLKLALSAVTAIVITTCGLSAETKDMRAVPKSNVDEVIYTEPNPKIYDTPAPYTESEIVKPSPSYSDTIIYAKPTKPLFRVGEPIRLKLKLRNKSHLYIWTVGYDGRGYMILPNRFNGYNRFKSNYAYVFPEKSLNFEFQSDRAGTEHVYILATNKPISRRKMEEIFNQRVGNYPTADAKATKDFTTKDIHVIAKRENLEYDIAHVAIRVTDGKRRVRRKPTTYGGERHNENSNVTININN